ncbi:family 43 glycosylhydrolase [Fusibacter sp. 3D3]|uniref:family 43 glycosylhydrolase n=1 Tax=Fusibacter sp. 3D3 TaxID=1048380 RepID=UPI00085382AE|nr:family 43 glycosylhydrolase [Fusibacter sp. 3D3]GAU75736.1 beta-xylosidase [Fusibacter sp. 3D3]
MADKFSFEKAVDAVQTGNMETLIAQLVLDPTWAEKKIDEDRYPVFIAASHGYFEMVKYFVEYSRCSMNISDSHNQTVLHYAAQSDAVALTEYLIDYVTEDPFRANKAGEIPFDIALKRGNQNLVAFYEERYGFKSGQYYRNPILEGFHPDPSIVCVGEDYYMVTSTFVFFPAIPIFHSKDLVNWKLIGHAVSNPEYLDLSEIDDGRGIWAPDISYNEGQFYITATLRMNDDAPLLRKQLVVHSGCPSGPYSRPTYIEEDGIDPSIFTDDDGRRYMLLNRGARIFEINAEGSEKLSDSKLIWYGSNKRAPEAPHLFKRKGYYYCLLAEGGTGTNHQVSIARSKALLGPYEPCPMNPILKQNNPLDPIQRSGHAKFVKDHQDNWWLVYLCGRIYKDQYTILGRETCLDPVQWTLEGWPIVNENRGPSSIQKTPDFCKVVLPKVKENDIFNQDWIFVRTPDMAKIINNHHNQFIRFYPDAHALCERQKCNTMVMRQDEFNFDVYFSFRHQHMTDGCEFGITGYYDTNTYVKFAVEMQDAKLHVFIEERIGETEVKKVSPIEIAPEIIDMRMKTECLNRVFYVRSVESKWIKAFELENVYYLCDEGIKFGKRFTGATFGIYGKGTKSNVDFSYDLLEMEWL